MKKSKPIYIAQDDAGRDYVMPLELKISFDSYKKLISIDIPDKTEECVKLCNDINNFNLKFSKYEVKREWKKFDGSECSKCGGECVVNTVSQEKNWIYQNEQARCVKCGEKGYVECNDEIADIIWYYDDLPVKV